jgi:two-component system response regulator MprA
MTKVLVADDSETVLLMLQRRLELAGYEVTTAADGEQTLEAMSGSNPPDLVLLDAMMPGISGIETLRRLRGSGDETPVLIVSASSYADEPEEALSAGADGCIPKPFDWEVLIAKIEALTG